MDLMYVLLKKKNLEFQLLKQVFFGGAVATELSLNGGDSSSWCA